MILALETAAPVGGVALVEAGNVLAERVLDMNRQAARDLIPALDELLTKVGRPLADITLVALSVGPGSFTGLRIGLSTALGLCFGSERRIVPVPTLAALAHSARRFDEASPMTDPRAAGDTRRSRIVPMLDARKGQVYAGVYAPEGHELRPDCVMDPLDFLRSLEPDQDYVLVGSGADLYRNEAHTVLAERARILDLSECGWPRAASVGLCAERALDRDDPRGVALEPSQVELRYLRASQAETERVS